MNNIKNMLDRHMAKEIQAQRHKGMSLGIFNDNKSNFYNYGFCENFRPKNFYKKKNKISKQQITKKEITEKNYFELASVSKIFTALLILKMAAKKTISLNDFLEKYIPEFSIKGSITIMDLLTHTSGLPREPDNFKIIAPANSYINYTDEMLLDDVSKIKPSPLIKGNFSYSNYGFILLGLVARRISGQNSFEKLLYQQVIMPLKLKNTYFKPDSNVLKNICCGHGPDLKPVVPYLNLGNTFSSAGALITNTEELLYFCNLLVNPDMISEELRRPAETLFSISHDLNKKPLSLGFHVKKDPNDAFYFYHPGNIGGHKCCIVICPEKKIALAYNTTTLSHLSILWDIIKAIRIS